MRKMEGVDLHGIQYHYGGYHFFFGNKNVGAFIYIALK